MLETFEETHVCACSHVKDARSGPDRYLDNVISEELQSWIKKKVKIVLKEGFCLNDLL